MAEAERFLLIGDSSEDRFPALSFHNYTETKKTFYCLDLGGLTEARGKSAGKPVFARVEDVPDDVGDLAGHLDKAAHFNARSRGGKGRRMHSRMVFISERT